MTSENQHHIYNTSPEKRFLISLLAFLGICLGSLLGYYQASGSIGKISFTGPVGFAIVTFLGTSKKIYVTSDRLIVKPFFKGAKEYLYSEGTFSLDTLTGIEALISSFWPNCLCITYTLKATEGKFTIGAMLRKNDIMRLYEEIQQKAGKSYG